MSTNVRHPILAVLMNVSIRKDRLTAPVLLDFH